MISNVLTWFWKRWLSHWIRYQRRNLALAIALLLVWIGILWGQFASGLYVFEGALVVREMSFSYPGPSDKKFLNPIREITSLDLEGTQKLPLTLTGEFSSDDPALNKQLQEQNQLTLQFPHANSRLFIKPETVPSELSLQGLSLFPKTGVEELAYRQTNNERELSFCLQDLENKGCNHLDSVTVSQQSTGELLLNLGLQSLQVFAAEVEIPELGMQADSFQDIKFRLVPRSRIDLVLELLSPTRLFVQLAGLPEAQALSEKPGWIRGDIAVTGVSFSRFDRTGDIKDDIETSTIVEGVARMKGKTLEVEEEQFLVVFSQQPGIEKLRRVRIHPEGLRVFLSGESKGIAVGLSKDLPVQEIKPSWLSQYISQEGFSAIVGFLSALTLVIFPPLFTPTPSDQKAEK
jgi:hypothetical protein